jgi:hypothetical protein
MPSGTPPTWSRSWAWAEGVLGERWGTRLGGIVLPWKTLGAWMSFYLIRMMTTFLTLRQYMTAIMEETKENLLKMKEIFDAFKQLSGLEINEGNTKVIRIGSNLNNVTPLTDEVKFKYVTSFTLLGIEIDNQLRNLSENFEKRKRKIRQKIAIW